MVVCSSHKLYQGIPTSPTRIRFSLQYSCKRFGSSKRITLPKRRLHWIDAQVYSTCRNGILHAKMYNLLSVLLICLALLNTIGRSHRNDNDQFDGPSIPKSPT